MKVRLAIAAALLALGVSAFTPTPAAAVPPPTPSGTLLCLLSGLPTGGDVVAIPFGPSPPPPDNCVQPITLRQAVQVCRGLGGHPVLVVIGGGGNTF